MSVPSSSMAGSGDTKAMEDPAGKAKRIVSGPMRALAAQIASRRLTDPSGPGSASGVTVGHE